LNFFLGPLRIHFSLNRRSSPNKSWLKTKRSRKEGVNRAGCEGNGEGALRLRSARGDDTERWLGKPHCPYLYHVSSLLCDCKRQTLGGNSPDPIIISFLIHELDTELCFHRPIIIQILIQIRWSDASVDSA
jgi:hypothetical protein